MVLIRWLNLENSVFASTAMPSGLQLPPVQLRAGLLPSRTLRLCVHVCVYGTCLLYIYLNFSVLVLLKWFWMWVLTVSVQSSHLMNNTALRMHIKQMSIKFPSLLREFISQRCDGYIFLPRTLKYCVFIMAALLKGPILCKFDFHACSVHVDCRFMYCVICKIWSFLKCIVRPLCLTCLSNPHKELSSCLPTGLQCCVVW